MTRLAQSPLGLVRRLTQVAALVCLAGLAGCGGCKKRPDTIPDAEQTLPGEALTSADVLKKRAEYDKQVQDLIDNARKNPALNSALGPTPPHVPATIVTPEVPSPGDVKNAYEAIVAAFEAKTKLTWDAFFADVRAQDKVRKELLADRPPDPKELLQQLDNQLAGADPKQKEILAAGLAALNAYVDADGKYVLKRTQFLLRFEPFFNQAEATNKYLDEVKVAKLTPAEAKKKFDEAYAPTGPFGLLLARLSEWQDPELMNAGSQAGQEMVKRNQLWSPLVAKLKAVRDAVPSDALAQAITRYLNDGWKRIEREQEKSKSFWTKLGEAGLKLLLLGPKLVFEVLKGIFEGIVKFFKWLFGGGDGDGKGDSKDPNSRDTNANPPGAAPGPPPTTKDPQNDLKPPGGSDPLPVETPPDGKHKIIVYKFQGHLFHEALVHSDPNRRHKLTIPLNSPVPEFQALFPGKYKIVGLQENPQGPGVGTDFPITIEFDGLPVGNIQIQWQTESDPHLLKGSPFPSPAPPAPPLPIAGPADGAHTFRIYPDKTDWVLEASFFKRADDVHLLKIPLSDAAFHPITKADAKKLKLEDLTPTFAGKGEKIRYPVRAVFSIQGSKELFVLEWKEKDKPAVVVK